MIGRACFEDRVGGKESQRIFSKEIEIMGVPSGHTYWTHERTMARKNLRKDHIRGWMYVFAPDIFVKRLPDSWKLDSFFERISMDDRISQFKSIGPVDYCPIIGETSSTIKCIQPSIMSVKYKYGNDYRTHH